MYSAFVLQFSFKHPWTKITSCDQEARAQLPKEAVALSKPPCHTAGHLVSAANEHIQLAEADFAQQVFTQTTSLHTAAFPLLRELQHLHLRSHPQGILLYPKTTPSAPRNHQFGYKSLWYIWPSNIFRIPAIHHPDQRDFHAPIQQDSSMCMTLTVLSSQHNTSLDLLARRCIPEAQRQNAIFLKKKKKKNKSQPNISIIQGKMQLQSDCSKTRALE